MVVKKQTAAFAANETKSKWTRIGAVGKAHGIKGAFFIADRHALLEHTPELVAVGDKEASVVSGFWTIKGRDALSLASMDSRTKCEAHRGQDLWVPKQADSKGSSLDELVGLEVIDSAGCRIGRVLNFYNYGASDTIEISDSQKRTLELPYISTYFLLAQKSIDRPIKMVVEKEIVAELWQAFEGADSC